jgi:hypothetical protein
MRVTETPTYQKVYNRIVSKEDFTYHFQKSSGRYVVASKNLYTGTNPSVEFNLYHDVALAVKKGEQQAYDSIGGWLDESTGIYYVDLNVHLMDLKIAYMLAEELNQKSIYDLEEEVAIHLPQKS